MVATIIPVYQGEQFIEEAIKSLLGQSRPPDEIIVVDDVSTDQSVSISMHTLSPQPVSYRVFSLSKNSGGPSRPINEAIRVANSKYIAVLDQDDIFHPKKLEIQVRPLESNPAILFCFGLFGRYADRDAVGQSPAMIDDIIVHSVDKGSYFEIQTKQLLPLILKHIWPIGGFPGFVFRREIWEKCGGIDETFGVSADMDFLCRICENSGAVAFVNRIGFYRRDHGGNLSGNFIRNTQATLPIWIRYLAYRNGIFQYESLPSVRAAVDQELRKAQGAAAIAGWLFTSVRFALARIRISGWHWQMIRDLLSSATSSIRSIFRG